MHLLVVALMIAAPLDMPAPIPAPTVWQRARSGSWVDARTDARTDGAPTVPSERVLARRRNDRCLGAGAAGGIGAFLGLAVGGGLALGATEIVKASDPNNATIGKRFSEVALPVMMGVGGLTGLAAGTLGGWELTEDLVGKGSVTR